MAAACIAASEPTGELVRLPDGRQLGFRRWGSRGPTYVLLHGLLDSSAGWSEVAQRLPHLCIAFDLPGFGASDQPTRPRISAYAEDVAAAIRALELRRFVLVGHSLGGAVAAAVAERLPDRVSALVLLAPAGFGRIALAETISIPGVRDVARRILPLALAHRASVRTGYRTMVSNGHEPEPDVIERVTASAAALVPGAVAATQAVVAAGLSKRAFHRRGLDYDGRVLALWGDRDRLVPVSHADGVTAALPQAEVEVWAGIGHHPQRECSGALLDLLARARHAPAQPALAPERLSRPAMHPRLVQRAVLGQEAA
jgi:pimeloyl-ACP methyl ester carboxylesterase